MMGLFAPSDSIMTVVPSWRTRVMMLIQGFLAVFNAVVAADQEQNTWKVSCNTVPSGSF